MQLPARTRRSCKTRAGTSRVHCAPSSLRSRESCPPDLDRRGPRCAHRLPRTPQPPRRRVGVRAAAPPPASARAPASRSGGPHGPPLRETAGSPRRVWAASPRAKNTRPGPRRCATLRLNACTDGAADVPARAGFHCAAPTVPALRAPGTPARKPLRCAARRDLRSAPSSLHCEREPPLAALASCAA